MNVHIKAVSAEMISLRLVHWIFKKKALSFKKSILPYLD